MSKRKEGSTFRQDRNLLLPKNHAQKSGDQIWGYTPIIQLGEIYLKDYEQSLIVPEFYKSLNCPACGARGKMKRHGAYGRYVLTLESGELTWTLIPVTRAACCSCASTHALLPVDVVAYCQYSLDILMILFCQNIFNGMSAPRVAENYQLPVWSVYLVLRRYEVCLSRIGLVLFELGYQPADHQGFTAWECLNEIQRQGMANFVYRYWQHNRRYLWQTRFHNRASPPVTMGWCKTRIKVFT